MATTIEIKERQKRQPFEEITKYLTSHISGFKSAVASLNNIWIKPGTPFSYPADTSGLEEAVYMVTLKLVGRGSAFLEELYQNISIDTGLIESKPLLRHPEKFVAMSYRILFDEFRNPHLNWIIWDMDLHCFITTPEGYRSMTTWLRHEISRQLQDESELGLGGATDDTIRDVNFRLPMRGVK